MVPSPEAPDDAGRPHGQPCPRRLLAAARHLAAGLPESMAAGLAGLPAATLRRLRDDPDFGELLDDCRAFEAMPKAERDAVLERLTRAAVEQALADARVGAIPAAMRLLGIVPARPPGGGGADDADDSLPSGEGSSPGEMPAVMRDVRIDEDGEWVSTDGLPVMPGRPLAVLDAPRGPVRVLDVSPASVPPPLLAALDGFDDVGVRDFNRSAHPSGGLQWDPVTRTVWCWGEPEEGPPPSDEAEAAAVRSAAAEAHAAPADLPEVPAPAAPAAVPTPAALPAPAFAARAAPVEVLPPADALEARLRRLLESAAAPAGPDDADLAEAVCALRWPNWPPYRGPLDLAAVREALHGRRVDERALARLGGSASTGPAAASVATALPGRPNREAGEVGRSAGPQRRRRREVDERAAAAIPRLRA